MSYSWFKLKYPECFLSCNTKHASLLQDISEDDSVEHVGGAAQGAAHFMAPSFQLGGAGEEETSEALIHVKGVSFEV